MKNVYENKKVLITGGLGLIGSSLAHRLVSLDADILIVDSMLPLYGANNFNLKEYRRLSIGTYQATFYAKNNIEGKMNAIAANTN